MNLNAAFFARLQRMPVLSADWRAALDNTFDVYCNVDWEFVARRQALNDLFAGRGFNPLSPTAAYFRGPKEGQFRIRRYAKYLRHYCFACFRLRVDRGEIPKPVSKFGLIPVEL